MRHGRHLGKYHRKEGSPSARSTDLEQTVPRSVTTQGREDAIELGIRKLTVLLHPEIIDEVLKYVYIPKDIADGVRQFAKQKAVEEAKAERDAKKAVKSAAKQSGKTG